MDLLYPRVRCNECFGKRRKDQPKLCTCDDIFDGMIPDDAQIRDVERTIKDYFVQHMQNSPSAAEREHIANGSSTVEVHMIKMSSRRLEGFAIISLRDKESTELVLGELRVVCEATMGEDSDQWLWKCQNK
jgi:hypothetical protein